MFVPFTIPSRGPDGQLRKSDNPVIHYGNVDTGSMVNVMYSGVLLAHPELEQYKQDFNHVITGVGDKVTKVVCKLVSVPISLGDDQLPGSCIRTTFYVLDCPSYHFILGLTALSLVNGTVYCGARRMSFTLGPRGKG